MKNWYNMKAQADEIVIFDEIGAYGVSAKQFISDMKAMKGESITLSINSPGGSVFDALAIYNALRQSGKTVNVKVMGVAASAASLIAMAGDKVQMPENAFLMIHNPWSFAVGDANEMREMADVLDKITDSLVMTYAKRSGKDEDYVRNLLSAETWLSAAEAVEAGFADEVIELSAVSASFDLDRLPERVKGVFAKQPAPEVTFAEQVEQFAAAQKMDAYAAHWALNMSTMDEVAQAANRAREIKALCALAKKPELAEAAILANKSVDDVRSELCAARADTQQIVDTAPPAASAKPEQKEASLKTADIWNARRKGARK